ncbi:MAG: hypothetical protein JNK23_17405 [Opitutaceae bacterium]|nr:hypothetical protein [Opitutaceae bacterium]
MRFFTLPALLAAALLSIVASLPWLPLAKLHPDHFRLVAEMTTTSAGVFQVYYDDGRGIREERSARTEFAASATPAHISVTALAGPCRAIRLDPIDRGGVVTLRNLRIVSATGRVVTTLPLERFVAAHQVDTLRIHEGALEITVGSASNDPQLGFTFAAPLDFIPRWNEKARTSFGAVGVIFATLVVLLLAVDRAPRFRAAVATQTRRVAARPGLAVALVAATAVIASAYPVVFLGKSHVSPNLGTILLYDNYPTLPGYRSAETTDVKLSDVGAVMWQHVPFSMMQRRALAGGEAPLWNRYNAAGVPLLAQGQSMFGDPLHLGVIAANGAAWAWDLKYLIAKWLFAAGLGLTVLALTRHTGAALVVALAAPFIGFFIYRVNHPAFFSLCYAPWPLYCLVRLAQAETRRGVGLSLAGLIVANLALMNSGTVKEAYMLLVSVNFSGGCVLLASPLVWRERLARLAALAGAGVVFVLLTAPIWATFLQTLKGAYTGYNAVSAYQIQPTLLLGAFDEIFYRPLMEANRVFSPSLNFLLLLGVLYFLATLREQFAQRAAIALAASSLVPLALAFGLIPPQWIVTLPFLGNIAHLDNTFSCVLIVLWSVVAGVGFATAARRLGTREGRADLAIAGLLLFALVFAWIAFRQAAHRPIFGPTFTVHEPGKVLAVDPFIWDYLAALLAASAVMTCLARRALVRHSLGVGSALLLFAAAGTLLWRHGLQAGDVGFQEFTVRPTVRADFHARSGAMDFARAAQAREPGRGFGFNGNFFPGWTGVYGLETIHGPDALVNPWLRELVGVSGVERVWDWRLYVEAANVATAQPFFDALNVRYYFDMLSKHPALARSLTLAHGADLDVWQSPTAWPRAFFTDRLASYEKPAELVEKIRTAAGRPLAAAQHGDRDTAAALATLPRDLATRTSTPATNYVLTENSTRFTVRAHAAGVIVLTEAFWPGDFRVEVNGRKAPILRLNHAFKGVVVDGPGDYTVLFRYVPKNWPRNLTLCGLGVAGLALLLWLALRPARRA